jgi:hypothetical protein
VTHTTEFGFISESEFCSPGAVGLTWNFGIVLLRNSASHAQRLEGSQTSPRRLKLREAPSGRPLYKMAALSVSSRRLPGMTQRNVLPMASIPYGGYNRPIERPHLETFPGAACLPTHRAARLQSGSPPGVRDAQPAACLHPFWVRWGSLFSRKMQ